MIKNEGYYDNEYKHDRYEVELQNDLNRMNNQHNIKMLNKEYGNIKYSHCRYKQREKAMQMRVSFTLDKMVDCLKAKLAMWRKELCSE